MSKRLIDADFADLQMFLENFMMEHPAMNSPESQTQLVRGLKGIMEIFHCGKTKACELKQNVISGAVTEHGGVIITDRNKAIELFQKYNSKHKVNEN